MFPFEIPPSRLLGAVAATLLCTAFAVASHAADHRDGTIAQDQPADIADTYVFLNPNDATKVVLGLTVNPYTVPGVEGVFSNDLLYQIKIDSTGDFVEDLVIQAVYDVSGDEQVLTLIGPTKPRVLGPINRLLVGDTTPNGVGGPPVDRIPSDGTVQELPDRKIRVLSGRTDDPFFIDLLFVRDVLGAIELPAGREKGFDLFAGLNVSALMLELPVQDLMASADGPLHVWSTVSRRQVSARTPGGPKDAGLWVQVDRQGNPALNAALIPADLRDAFNRDVPHRDEQFLEKLAAALADNPNLPLSREEAEAIAKDLLPDVLTLDIGSTAPFPNGRAPYDDFIDVVLRLLSNGSIGDDGVDANDSGGPLNGFPDVFPFLGAEHQPSETIPPRDDPGTRPN